MQTSKSEQIRHALRDKPVIKHGDLAEIARQFGTSRELVRVAMHHKTVRKALTVYKRTYCKCGKRLNPSTISRLCQNCFLEYKTVNLSCHLCGALITRTLSVYARSKRHFCGHSCRQKHTMARRYKKPIYHRASQIHTRAG